jgi:hypothetical protein
MSSCRSLDVRASLVLARALAYVCYLTKRTDPDSPPTQRRWHRRHLGMLTVAVVLVWAAWHYGHRPPPNGGRAPAPGQVMP